VVKQILDDKGNGPRRGQPDVAGDESLRVIDARNAYLMDSMMHDVVRRGTATRAQALKRSDLAGKTGTTNDYVDAWFCGYQPTWSASPGSASTSREARQWRDRRFAAALPIWIGFMEKALKNVPESFPKPEGLVPVSIPAGAAGEAASRTS
jgi:penicillin-binding protein 1A